MNLLDFVERESDKNASFHLACADALEKQANALLLIVLAGAGASFWTVVKLIHADETGWLVIALGVVSVYLFVIAGVITLQCLWARDLYPPANEPKHLWPEDEPDANADEVRQSDINTKQACIDLNRDRNDRVGLWLNRCRIATALTPVVFAIAAFWVVY